MVRIGEDVSEHLDIFRHSSSCTATSVANGPESAARPWSKNRWSHRSLTKACPLPDWWHTPSSAASSTTSLTTARSRSKSAPAFTRRAQRWRLGPARQVLPWYTCMQRTGSLFSAVRWFMPTRRQLPCWIPGSARPNEPTSGPMPEVVLISHPA